MPWAIIDSEEDEERAPLPDSVDRELAKVVSEVSLRKLDIDALDKLDLNTTDSNIDRVQTFVGFDILADGTLAVMTIRDALKRRALAPIQPGEMLRLIQTDR